MPPARQGQYGPKYRQGARTYRPTAPPKYPYKSARRSAPYVSSKKNMFAMSLSRANAAIPRGTEKKSYDMVWASGDTNEVLVTDSLHCAKSATEPTDGGAAFAGMCCINAGISQGASCFQRIGNQIQAVNCTITCNVQLTGADPLSGMIARSKNYLKVS